MRPRGKKRAAYTALKLKLDRRIKSTVSRAFIRQTNGLQVSDPSFCRGCGLSEILALHALADFTRQ